MNKGSSKSSNLLADISPQLPAEVELQVFLSMAREQFESDRSTALHAFLAIGYLTSYDWRIESREEPQEISVPYWIMKALGIGWMNYREANSAKRTTTLGEAYNIEGGGQGKSKKVKNLDFEFRDFRIATKIAIDHSNGSTITAAKSDVSNLLGLSEETINRIWKKMGKKAKQAVKNVHMGQNLTKP